MAHAGREQNISAASSRATGKKDEAGHRTTPSPLMETNDEGDVDELPGDAEQEEGEVVTYRARKSRVHLA